MSVPRFGFCSSLILMTRFVIRLSIAWTLVLFSRTAMAQNWSFDARNIGLGEHLRWGAFCLRHPQRDVQPRSVEIPRLRSGKRHPRGRPHVAERQLAIAASIRINHF
jgi:hypothetical protein